MLEKALSALDTEFPLTGTVLVVDDDPLALAYARRLLLAKGFQVVQAPSGEEALRRLKTEGFLPDVIVLDMHMDGMNGIEFLREIKADPRLRLIPVLVVTGDKEYKIEALNLGASDFIAKPFRVAEMQAKINTQVRMCQAVKELESIEDILLTLANTVEARDAYTEAHTRHVSVLSGAVGRALHLEDKGDVRVLELAGHLHDIGKIGVSDAILVKRGPLTEDETTIMRTHSLIGYNLLKPLRSLRDALPGILHHHERWDGSGYPGGLTGESIPLAARVVGLVDCFDALTTTRPYRAAMPREKAIEIILRDENRRLWDPNVLDVFLSVLENPDPETQGAL